MALIGLLDSDTTNLHFVKNTISVKCSKAKHNKVSHAYILKLPRNCATKLHILNIHQLKMSLPTPADLSNFAFNFKNQLKWSLPRKAFPWPQVHLLNTSTRVIPSAGFQSYIIVFYTTSDMKISQLLVYISPPTSFPPHS